MTSYYIMQNGQLMGPADDAKIKSLLSRGLVSMEAIISQDRLNWFPVKNLLEVENRPEADLLIREPSHHHAAIPKPLMVLIWVLVLALALLVSASGVVLFYTGTLQRWFPMEQVEEQEQEQDEPVSEAGAEERKDEQ